jgi:RTA1 like protein
MTAASSDFVFYHYEPSLAAAITLLILFFVSTNLHFYQLLRTRTWYMIPLLIGGFCEWIGYVGRTLSSTESPDYSLGPYILQAILLLIAPALFAASIYMELGYIILVVDGEKRSLVKEKYLTKLFVIGDVFSFLVQSTGEFFSDVSFFTNTMYPFHPPQSLYTS